MKIYHRPPESTDLISIDSLFYSIIGEVNSCIIMNNGMLTFDKAVKEEFQQLLEMEV